MDNMKPLAFVEAEMPLHRLDPELAQEVEKFARIMAGGASVAGSILGIALRRALFGPKAEVKLDQTILGTARERLWEITEDAFHKSLDEALSSLVDDPEGDAQDKLAQSWRGCLERAAHRIFNDTAPIESLHELDPQDVVEGRNFLVLALKGYGKIGSDFFRELGNLQPPETRKKRISTSKEKSKGEISE